MTRDPVEQDMMLLRIDHLEAEVERLMAANAEQKAEMQKLYDNWVRVLKLPEEPKP